MPVPIGPENGGSSASILRILGSHLAAGNNDQAEAYNKLHLLTISRYWGNTYRALADFVSIPQAHGSMFQGSFSEWQVANDFPFYLEKSINKLCYLVAEKATEQDQKDPQFRQFLLNAAAYNTNLAKTIIDTTEANDFNQDNRPVNSMICHLIGHAAWLESRYSIVVASDDYEGSLAMIQQAQEHYLAAIAFADEKNLSHEKFIYGVNIFENTIKWLQAITPVFAGMELAKVADVADTEEIDVVFYIASILNERPGFFADTSSVLRNALSKVAMPIGIYAEAAGTPTMLRKNAAATMEYLTDFISASAMDIIRGYSLMRKGAILMQHRLSPTQQLGLKEHGYDLTAQNLPDNFLVYELMLLNITLLMRTSGEGTRDDIQPNLLTKYIDNLKESIAKDTEGVRYLRGEGSVSGHKSGLFRANPDGPMAGIRFNAGIANVRWVQEKLQEVRNFLTLNKTIVQDVRYAELISIFENLLNYFKPVEGSAGGNYSKKRKK